MISTMCIYVYGVLRRSTPGYRLFLSLSLFLFHTLSILHSNWLNWLYFHYVHTVRVVINLLIEKNYTLTRGPRSFSSLRCVITQRSSSMNTRHFYTTAVFSFLLFPVRTTEFISLNLIATVLRAQCFLSSFDVTAQPMTMTLISKLPQETFISQPL